MRNAILPFVGGVCIGVAMQLAIPSLVGLAASVLMIIGINCLIYAMQQAKPAHDDTDEAGA